MEKLSIILAVSFCWLHGITRSIAPDAVIHNSSVSICVAGINKLICSNVIKRSDFVIGVGFADVVLGDQVTIHINDEFIKV